MNAKFHALVHARWFEATIMVVIILAGVLAGLETSPASLKDQAGRARQRLRQKPPRTSEP